MGHYRGGFDFSGLVETARELRQQSTPAGKLFWELVRDRRFDGLKFRREHQIGEYIADFYCDEKKLVVELDGEVHNTEKRKKTDEKRDAYLRSLGITVVRISNEFLLNKTEEAFQTITQVIEAPLPLGEAGVRASNTLRDRRGEVLFVDARKIGSMISRTQKELDADDIAAIANTYHSWRGEKKDGIYEDVAGYCKSATIDEIKKHDFVLTPGRYVGAAALEDDGIPFETKMQDLSSTLFAQMKEATTLDQTIRENLKGLGYEE